MAFDPGPDPARAATPAGDSYGEQAFARQQERLFPRTWHLTELPRAGLAPRSAEPFTLLPGALDEPLLWSHDGDRLHCLANVCTHRGRILVDEPGPRNALRCAYHGRCFELDGRLRSAPGFEGAHDFPSARDDLARPALGTWAGLRFTALDPAVPFAEFIAETASLLGFFAAQELPARPADVRAYEFDANWALYVENYLEGLHIPYVHPGLSRALDLSAYAYENLAHGTLQVGFANDGDPALPLPPEHRFAGRAVAALYVFLFPTTMINVYPWGASLNLVQPLAPTRTRVVFQSYVVRPELREAGAGAALHQVELEDEAAVVATQRGLRSRLYRGGRYAPRHEAGTHWFHRLLARF